MQYSIFIGVTEYELTPYVIPQTVKLEESLYRDLKANANKISFQVSRNCPYIDEIILNDDESIRLEVKNDDDSWFFYGYLAGNYKGEIRSSGFTPFALSAACPSITLLRRPWNSPTSSYTSWIGDKVCDPADTAHSFLHKAATLNGVVLSSSLPTITDTVDTSILDSDNLEVWAVLEKALFESHYVFYFQKDGTLALYNFYISGTITPAHTFTNSNAGKIELDAALKKYKSFSLKYKETETLLAQVISKDTTGGDAIYECNIALPAGTYYPSMGTADKDEFAEYALESGKEIVNVSAAHVDLTLETGLTYEFQNIGTRARFRIYNPTGGTLHIRRCRIVADSLTAIKSENEARINGDDSAVYEYEAEHIHAVARAETFIKILADYFAYSRKEFSFPSPDDVALGTIVRLYESVEGLDVYAVVSDKTTTFSKDNSKKYKYSITAVTSMTLAGSVVPSSVSSNPPIPEGPEGPPGLAVALSNGTHVFPASALGAVSSYANSGTLIRVYAGAAELIYDAVGTDPGTWKVTPAALRITCGAITDSGAYATVADHSAFADGDDTAQITYTIDGVTPAGEAFSLTIAQVFTKAKTGQTGTTGAQGVPGVGVVTWNLPSARISMADAHTMEKTAGTDGVYDASAYSSEKYGAAGISFRPHQVNRRLMVGLNVDPDTGSSEADIDHALCLMEDGTVEIWQSGVKVYEPETAYLAGDVFNIVTDGQHVFFLQNGAVFFIAYDPGKAFAFDSSFYHLGARINYVGFSSGASAPRAGDYLGTVSAVPDAATFAPVKMAGDWCLCTADGVYYRWTGAAWATTGITMAMKMRGLQDFLELSDSPLTVAFMDVLAERIAARIIEFEDSVGSVSAPSPSVGDLIAYMGKDPRRPGDTSRTLEIALKEYMGDNGGTGYSEEWRAHFMTKKIGSVYGMVLSGLLMSCGGVMSRPGMLWTSRTHPFGSSEIYSVASGGGVSVAVAQLGKMARSTDGGLTWGSLITNPFGTSTIYRIYYGDGTFIAVAQSGKMARSTDGGLTWGSLITNPFGTNTVGAIYYYGGTWFAGSANGEISRSTDDGLTWGSLITNPFGASYIFNFYGGNGIIIAFGESGKMARSTDDGLTWGSLITNPFGTTGIWSVFYSDGVWCAVANFGKMARSTDGGLTWGSLITNPFGTSYITEIKCIDGVWLAVGGNGKICRSTDGCLTWVEPGESGAYTPFGSTPLWRGIALDDSGNIIIVGDNGSGTSYIITSSWVEAGAGVIERGISTDGRISVWKFSDHTMIVRGWDFVQGNGTAGNTKDITLPVSFKPGSTTYPGATCIGYKDGSDPATIIDRTALPSNQWAIAGMSTTDPETVIRIGYRSNSPQASQYRFLIKFDADGEWED